MTTLETELLDALKKIAGGFCPGSLIDNAHAEATSQEDAQRLFHMEFSAWMQKIAREAIEKAPAA